MVAVTLRMPVDVVDDLKLVAPALGHSGYQPLIRAYVGRGLRGTLSVSKDRISRPWLPACGVAAWMKRFSRRPSQKRLDKGDARLDKGDATLYPRAAGQPVSSTARI